MINLLFLLPVHADTKQPIVVNGERVEYLYEQKKIIGKENVSIVYKDVILTCDTIEVQTDTKDAVAVGNVVLKQDGNVIRGHKIHYNFEKKKGTIIEAEARMKPWYGKGRRAVRVDEDEYAIERGHITTCNLPRPHYRVTARTVKFFEGDRIEVHHAVVFIGRIPVFYFPMFVHLLRDDRPRVTIVPGRNSTWGFYLLTAWRYYLHEWSRGYIHLDWREEKGMGYGLDYKYRLGYFGKGLARFYYIHEDEHERTLEEEITRQDASRDRWRVQLRHKWSIDADTLAVGEFNKISDELFLKDYYFEEEFSAGKQPETYVSLIKTRPDYNMSFFTRVRTHDFFTVVERLPELKVNVKSQKLRNTDFYYKSTTSYSMLQKKFDKALHNRPKLKANRLDTRHELSYLARAFNFLTIKPYTAVRETWYSEDINGRENELRHVYTLGTELSTKFYRVFDVSTDALGLNINKLKHTITPKLDYRYVPTPNMEAGDLKRFDAIDGIASQNGLDMQLINTLQTRRGEEVINLARLSLSSALLLERKVSVSEEREQDRVVSYFLDDLQAQLELKPYHWLSVYSDSVYSPEMGDFRALNFDLVAYEEDYWDLGFGFRYEDYTLENPSSQITVDASYRISPKWKINGYHRYKKDTFQDSLHLDEQTYGVERDLHCWLAELNYQIRETDGREANNEHRIWLVMRLKAFPEMPFKMFSAKYTAPSAGVGADRSRGSRR